MASSPDLNSRLADEFASGQADLDRSPQTSAIPSPSEDMPSVLRTVRALKTVLDSMQGTGGSVLDKSLSLRDLLDIGALIYSPSTGLTTSTPVFTTITGGSGGGSGGSYDPTELGPYYTVPPTPTNVEAVGLFQDILVTWDLIQYRNHAFVEVFRNSVDNQGTAVLVATVPDNRYVDTDVTLGASYYYWVRSVNVQGARGEFNAISGTGASLVIPAQAILDSLLGDITESHLYTSLNSRIDLIDGSGPGSVNARIAVESSVRQSETGALFAQYTVKIDNNGYVTGYGLASEPAVDGTPFSTFAVVADRFYIASPTINGSTPTMPFVVQTGSGVWGNPGVYISNASIQNAAITTAKIGDLAVSNVKIANDLDAGKITVGTLDAARIGAESITAGKIDTRNLAIKDSAGNIVFSSGVLRSRGTNLIDPSWWAVGAAFLWGSNNANGSNTNFVQATRPDGSAGVVMRAEAGGVAPAEDSAGGGWNPNSHVTSGFPVDKTREYLFAVYIQVQTTGSIGGYAYWGIEPDTVCSLNTSTPNGNPYFATIARSALTVGRWYLFVGKVFPYGSTGNSSVDAGIYDCTTGVQIGSGLNFNWANVTYTNGTRAYMYYSRGGVQYFSDPQAWVCDGTQPSLDELLAMGTLSGRNKVTAGNVSTFISSAAITNAYIGDYIASSNFNGSIAGDDIVTNGSSGWAIAKGGKAVFQNVVVRGDVQATSITDGSVSSVSTLSPGAFTLTPSSGIAAVNGQSLGSFSKNVAGSRLLVTARMTIEVQCNASFGGLPEAEYGIRIWAYLRLYHAASDTSISLPIWWYKTRTYLTSEDEVWLSADLGGSTISSSWSGTVSASLYIEGRVLRYDYSTLDGASVTATTVMQNLSVTPGVITITEVKG